MTVHPMNDPPPQTHQTERSGNFRDDIVHIVRKWETFWSDKRKIEASIPDTVSYDQYNAVIKVYRSTELASDRIRSIWQLFNGNAGESVQTADETPRAATDLARNSKATDH